MNTSTQLARRIVTELIEGGINDIVLSPGSRNAPLSIALYEAEKAGLLNLHIRIDERTAGFFALGIAKAAKKAAAVVCTSGTAVANYHPAVLEAHHSHIPLLVITADRPARMRETGANQTTIQNGIFANAVAYEADISDPDIKLTRAFNGLLSGPVHLNLQFDEPLVPDDKSKWLKGIKPRDYLLTSKSPREELVIRQSRGVLVIGHDRAGLSVTEITDFAIELGWPIVAEDPLSFPNSIAHASLFLTSEKTREILQPDVVLVIGRTTLSRSINALVKSARKEIVIDPRTVDIDVKRSADQILEGLPELTKEFTFDEEWIPLWHKYSEKAKQAIADVPDWSEQNIARQLSARLPEGSTLFISSSRPIRDIEGFAEPRAGIETFANRGLAGIDGNISTSLGIASQRDSAVAVIGDLSFLHDLTGLIGAKGINLRILVLNNDGGGIFSTLPQNGVDGFEKIFGTPHGLDLNAIATSMGITTKNVKNMKQLLQELSLPIQGISVLVADLPNREVNAKYLKKINSTLL